jgi:hypothetical protein
MQVRAAYDKAAAREREALAYMERCHDNITGNTLAKLFGRFPSRQASMERRERGA